jgi:hypothetical protein
MGTRPALLRTMGVISAVGVFDADLLLRDLKYGL